MAMARDYGPILRRDPTVQSSMQRFIAGMEKGDLRASGMGVGEVSDKGRKKKEAYLARLGIKPKKLGEWDVNHMQPGDKFAGTVEHPELGKVDIKVEIGEGGKAEWVSTKGEFDESAEVVQDHPVEQEPGDQRNRDIAAYIFSKFNYDWRDFDGPMPTKEDVAHIELAGLQLWFRQVASVDGYPTEEEYNEAVTDKSKGMSLDDFLKFIVGEDPEYLDKTWDTVFTGRRLRIFSSVLELDGDFSKKTQGNIYGFATYKGEPGGEFNLALVK